ncbi:hypothetical protein Pmani_006214 [Petrolisthes manimaculis]|uniref:Reverse transcriptase domain-containing protein n=1 Tax=Petrolisthes manimaculis TaxID=1843537 RepID=A0AAE1ULB1_9EUCA|nr:hypothetical protein Pmani_006214 [Petrolisthes manimaculis]
MEILERTWRARKIRKDCSRDLQRGNNQSEEHKAVRENPPWCVLYADDVILLAKSKRALQRKLKHWREALESRETPGKGSYKTVTPNRDKTEEKKKWERLPRIVTTVKPSASAEAGAKN